MLQLEEGSVWQFRLMARYTFGVDRFNIILLQRQPDILLWYQILLLMAAKWSQLLLVRFCLLFVCLFVFLFRGQIHHKGTDTATILSELGFVSQWGTFYTSEHLPVKRTAPVLHECLFPYFVTKIVSGSASYAALTNKGLLFTW
jgi:hypothetical protein